MKTLKKYKFTIGMDGFSMPDPLKEYYERVALQAASTIDNLIFGQIVGWRKTKVTKYLKLPVIHFESHYDEDGEYRGLLMNVQFINTHIPIGKEIIESPMYRKMAGTIKFNRYGSLKAVKSTKKKKATLPSRSRRVKNS